MADEPIEDQNYLSGLTVIDIGDIRVSRGMTRRPVSSCGHRRMAYDPKERRIWCKDCEKDVDPFDAFKNFSLSNTTARTKICRARGARSTRRRNSNAGPSQPRTSMRRGASGRWSRHALIAATVFSLRISRTASACSGVTSPWRDGRR